MKKPEGNLEKQLKKIRTVLEDAYKAKDEDNRRSKIIDAVSLIDFIKNDDGDYLMLKYKI